MSFHSSLSRVFHFTQDCRAQLRCILACIWPLEHHSTSCSIAFVVLRRKQEYFSYILAPFSLSAKQEVNLCQTKGQKERWTIFMDIDGRVSICFLEVLQHILQGPWIYLKPTEITGDIIRFALCKQIGPASLDRGAYIKHQRGVPVNCHRWKVHYFSCLIFDNLACWQELI